MIYLVTSKNQLKKNEDKREGEDGEIGAVICITLVEKTDKKIE